MTLGLEPPGAPHRPNCKVRTAEEISSGTPIWRQPQGNACRNSRAWQVPRHLSARRRGFHLVDSCHGVGGICVSYFEGSRSARAGDTGSASESGNARVHENSKAPQRTKQRPCPGSARCGPLGMAPCVCQHCSTSSSGGKSDRCPRMLGCKAMGGDAIAGIVPCCRTMSRQSQG